MPASSLVYTWRDMWKAFPDKKQLDKDTYKVIISTFNHLFMRDLIDNGSIRKAPYGAGTFFIGKRDLMSGVLDRQEAMARRTPIFYAAFQKKKEKFLLHFRHTNNYVAKIRWSKQAHCTLKSRQLFAFKPLKVFRKYISYSVREKNAMEKYWDLK